MSASTSSREDNAGDVVYSRSAGIGDQAEDWDDTALVEAYDAALGGILDELDKREKRPPARAASSPQTKWSKGQFCRAQYTEDKQWYEAKIIVIDDAYCIVKYLGYMNHERQPLSALKPSGGHKQRQLQIQSVEIEQGADSDESLPAAEDVPVKSEQSTSIRKKVQSQRERQQQQLEHLLQLQEEHVRVASEAEPERKPSSSKQSLKEPAKDSGRKRGAKESSLPSTIAFPPPPPPFPPGVDEICESDEALAAMLISWYISGYHTGYYTAVRNSSKR